MLAVVTINNVACFFCSTGFVNESFSLSDQPTYGTWHIEVRAFVSLHVPFPFILNVRANLLKHVIKNPGVTTTNDLDLGPISVHRRKSRNTMSNKKLTYG